MEEEEGNPPHRFVSLRLAKAFVDLYAAEQSRLAFDKKFMKCVWPYLIMVS